MNRRVVIIILIVLIVGVVGGTIWLVLNRLDSDTTPDTQTPGGLETAKPGSQTVVDPTGDDDADGLTNAEEFIWGSDPRNPDTDGDGFQDGEEVENNHNPTIPAPNDQLPANFQPGQEINPLDIAPLDPTAVDQFFSTSLDLDGPDGNMTDGYKADYSEEERNPETLANYVATHPIITQLPQVNTNALNTVPENTAGTVEQHIHGVGNLSLLSDQNLMLIAMDTLVNAKDPSEMLGIVASFDEFQQRLIELPVPPESIQLQRLLLGYTEIIEASLLQVTKWNEDPVRAMTALRQIGAIEQRYLSLIQQEKERIETKYSIESDDGGAHANP